MSKINILSESVYNKIAAGEVVEKPASVVKELLDNSIDAGATNIKISIEDGGIKNITVEDNGCGIEPDDFDKVFISHSTSKIKTEADLEKIGTLGFRGEALASIASISKVTLTSKVETETFARTCEIVGGKQGETTEIGANNGTTISVSDIFFNVPARAKFLKKPKSEASEITNLVERYILCNPSISFKYVVDGKEVLLSTGSNLFDAIFVVYGKATTDGIIKVDYQNPKSDIKVSGYIGLPTFSKPNRTYQTLSINGRYISSQLVSSCIYNAYEHYLMKGQFPFYVLNLEIPFEKLDVNVHPNKMEVRFNNSNEIYGNVYNAVSTALYNCDKITSPTDSITQPKEVKFGTSFSLHSTENTDENNTMQTKTVQIEIENKNEFKNVFDDFQVDKKTFSDNKQVDNLDTYKLSKSFEKIDFSTGVISEPSNSILNKIKNNSFEQTMLNEIDSQSQKTKTQEFFENADVKFIGQIFALYLIVEKNDKVYIIDEHAGHERLLFDRLVKEVDNRNVSKQHLISPYVLNVNRQEYEFLEENIEKLQALGFEVEPFGTTSFAVNSVPAILTDIDIKKFFDGILHDLSNFKSLKQSDLILNKLMQHSCKCAVRAGKMLSSGEVNTLINQMKEEQMQLQCPHGRPVVVELSKTDIEKWFKRIV